MCGPHDRLQRASRSHRGRSADGGYLREQGLSATQDLLTRDAGIQAIRGENEDMALGASQALGARGIEQWDGGSGVVVVGADGLVPGMQAVRSGLADREHRRE
ncbi:hypothetical protein [Pseudonocardia acidicola]|uniref:Uncharacterized protein n=1 Tax=Pseudonocardia acidicola TaxID=2724939 RepID=A0ABX1S8I4_9PSEU|nr:hypothetical protein [Pseudonocardia acidicola]NMH97869.1 hypothetical protein [Pseudonocardia acidicola]